jgi:hypothetical protein
MDSDPDQAINLFLAIDPSWAARMDTAAAIERQQMFQGQLTNGVGK